MDRRSATRQSRPPQQLDAGWFSSDLPRSPSRLGPAARAGAVSSPAMTTQATTTRACPRCYADVPLDGGVRFCPRCGVDLPPLNVSDAAPVEVVAEGRVYHVMNRIGVGSRCAVYRCRFGGNYGVAEGTFKVARDPVSNAAVAREAELLRRLRLADRDEQFAPFLPSVVTSFGYVGGPGEVPRHANVLRLHPDVKSPADDLYTLAEVRAAYPDGLDARDMAWVWRRLLTVLGFAHRAGVSHGAVLPVHVLIDPADHKLVLIGWGSAMQTNRPTPDARPAVPAGYRAWVVPQAFPTPAGDLQLAARTMADLVGGDAAENRFPPGVEPAVARHLNRVANVPAADAWQVRDEFDRLIEALWGPREFRPLTSRPIAHSVA